MYFYSNLTLTTSPFESVSIENIYNNVFNDLISKGKFKLVKTFDMKNGYNINIYERVVDMDYEEAKMYADALEDETKNYSSLYKDVIKNYIKENNSMINE